jgi:hypothetical protein
MAAMPRVTAAARAVNVLVFVMAHLPSVSKIKVVVGVNRRAAPALLCRSSQKSGLLCPVQESALRDELVVQLKRQTEKVIRY